ncbi:Aste57867_8287 [Aphanomyces stellatus]|uniref:Aste57867_8287 protein n=1 Tax=Aphanomyces stellatus TaxID=120398 RepID=A0A485KK05_9STRA|nr:hypothetical protein As57867_008256 [Aphanomyces stellatus]VFT85174.1 Aste57867_8287 [Aphanomyces stellatus]
MDTSDTANPTKNGIEVPLRGDGVEFLENSADAFYSTQVRFWWQNNMHFLHFVRLLRLIGIIMGLTEESMPATAHHSVNHREGNVPSHEHLNASGLYLVAHNQGTI